MQKILTLILSLLVLTSETHASEEIPLQSVSLPGHGALIFPIPASWNINVLRPPMDLPPTIELSPAEGESFKVLITPTWIRNSNKALSNDQSLKKTIERSAIRASSQAVESMIEVESFSGVSGDGYLFSATDSAPKPGEYKFLTQGAIQVGNLDVTFTILTNDESGEIANSALSVIKAVEQSNTEKH